MKLALLLIVLLAPSVLAAPLLLREGMIHTYGRTQLQLLIVSDDAAIFIVDGHPTPVLRQWDETTLPDGEHLVVREILANRRTGMASFYLWG